MAEGLLHVDGGPSLDWRSKSLAVAGIADDAGKQRRRAAGCIRRGAGQARWIEPGCACTATVPIQGKVTR